MTISEPLKNFSKRFLSELGDLASRIDPEQIDALARMLAKVRTNEGRVFILGVGGGAANAAHAVCDLRGLANIEAYAPTDSVASITATTNDYGWKHVFRIWLAQSRVRTGDLVLVFSVGGGSITPPVSENLVDAMHYAKQQGALIAAVVGPIGGAAVELSDICVRVPVTDGDFVTTHTEIFQAVVWHMLVTHPSVTTRQPHWESLGNA